MTDQPLTLTQQVQLMQRFVSVDDPQRMLQFLNDAGFYRASRYGSFLLSRSAGLGCRPGQDMLFSLYQFDMDLRHLLIYYCHKAEIRFKNMLSIVCVNATQSPVFYLDQQYYAPSKGERDAMTRADYIRLFDSFFENVQYKEEKVRRDTARYPELKDYRKGGSREQQKLPVWIYLCYNDFGTATRLFSYLRGDLRKKVLSYACSQKRYSKRDTQIFDLWLDAVRNLRNYCAHNSMLIGLSSSIILPDQKDAPSLLPEPADLYSRLYALKKLLSPIDADALFCKLQKHMNAAPAGLHRLHLLPERWEEMFSAVVPF